MSDGKMFRATLWEEDGKAFQYTMRIEPMAQAMPAQNELAAQNTDRELWREEDSYYANSIFVTDGGGIGINVGGSVIVKSLKEWHAAARRGLENETPERPILHNPSAAGRAVPDDLGIGRPLPEEPRMEAMAPDRPAEPTLVEKVAKAVAQTVWDAGHGYPMLDMEARAAIAVVLRDLWQIGADRNTSFGAAMASEIFCYARENGIDLNGK